MKQRIEEITNILNEANYNYYVLDNPTITDQEYDRYMQELIKLEEKYPELKKENSPTSRVGGTVIDEFKKVNHIIPMLSLSNVFNESDIINFDEKIRKEVKHPKYVIEPKNRWLISILILRKWRIQKSCNKRRWGNWRRHNT